MRVSSRAHKECRGWAQLTFAHALRLQSKPIHVALGRHRLHCDMPSSVTKQRVTSTNRSILDDGKCSLEFLGGGEGGGLTHNSRGSGRLPAGMNTSSKKPSVTVPRHDERWVSMVRLNMGCCVPRDKAYFAARACSWKRATAGRAFDTSGVHAADVTDHDFVYEGPKHYHVEHGDDVGGALSYPWVHAALHSGTKPQAS